jgi:hypothetical protein
MKAYQQDVVESIMSFISQDYSSVSACALVCHSFCLAAQRHVFRTVELRNSNRCQGLLNLLEQNSGLALYVKKVTLRGMRDDDVIFDDPEVTSADNKTMSSWLQSAAGQSLVGFLTNVNHLKFEDFYFGVTFPESPSPLFSMMERIEILEVDGCHLKSTRQLMELISLCPFVTTLYLSLLRCLEHSSYEQIQQWVISSKLNRKEAQTTRPLEKMKVNDLSDELLDEFSTWISHQGLARSLHTLEVNANNFNHSTTGTQPVQTMLDQACPCLEMLTLRRLLFPSHSARAG